MKIMSKKNLAKAVMLTVLAASANVLVGANAEAAGVYAGNKVLNVTDATLNTDYICADDGSTITVTSGNVNVDLNVDSNVGFHSYGAGIFADAFNPALNSSVAKVGTSATDTINVKVAGSIGKPVYGLLCDRYGEGKNAGGQPLIVVKGKNLNITVTSDDWAKGIHVANSTDDANSNQAKIIIDAENTVINATSTAAGGDKAAGISAMSQGIVEINGNLEINANAVISARGGSVVTINKNKDKTVKLNGDIVFDYYGANSGTEVDAAVNVNLSGSNSAWNGNTVVDWSGATDEAKLAVKSMELSISNGAQWTPTRVENEGTAEDGSKPVAVTNVTLNDGIINLGEDNGKPVTALVKNIEGTGTINVDSLDASMNIEKKASDADLTVAATSKITDQIAKSGDTTAGLQSLANVVSSGTGDDKKSVADTVTAAEGTVAGALTAEVDENGNIIAKTVKEQVNVANQGIGDMAALALITWRAENNDMNKRLGELRDSKGEHGVWARMVRGESEYKSVKSQYNTYQLGYDEKLSNSPDWTVGAAFSYNKGTSTYEKGGADNKDKAIAIYGSKLNEDGSFIDLIAKYARLDNKYTVAGGVGNCDYGTNAYSVSAEYGKRFTKDNGLWIEPQAELTYGKVASASYTSDNGSKIDQDGMDSLVGRIGFAAGKNLSNGNIYARASYLYDFDGDASVSFTKEGVTRKDSQDIGGGWFEVGVGTNINLSDATHLYVDVEKTFSGEVKTNWQWNAGVRYSF